MKDIQVNIHTDRQTDTKVERHTERTELLTFTNCRRQIVFGLSENKLRCRGAEMCNGTEHGLSPQLCCRCMEEGGACRIDSDHSCSEKLSPTYKAFICTEHQ